MKYVCWRDDITVVDRHRRIFGHHPRPANVVTSLPPSQPGYQPPGSVAPGHGIVQFMQPEQHLRGLGRPRLPRLVVRT